MPRVGPRVRCAWVYRKPAQVSFRSTEPLTSSANGDRESMKKALLIIQMGSLLLLGCGGGTGAGETGSGGSGGKGGSAGKAGSGGTAGGAGHGSGGTAGAAVGGAG